MQYQFVHNTIIEFSNEINQILNYALCSVDSRNCVDRNIQIDRNILYVADYPYQLTNFENIYLIGAGKAVIPMAQGVIHKLKKWIQKGYLIAKHGDMDILHRLPSTITVSFGDHPLPSVRSIQSTRGMLKLAESAREEDLVICLISGGGSALMTLPSEGIELSHLQELTELLLQRGANIEEINTIRKHIDCVKGGGLLKSIYPSTSISLILSDVLGDHIPSIASGPTEADPSTYQDAMDIINKYNLKKELKSTIIRHIEDGIVGKKPETIKRGDAVLRNHKNVIVGSLRMAVEAAEKKAKELGFYTEMLSLQMVGEARDVGRQLGDLLRTTALNKKSSKPLCMIAGGEPTVTIKGSGKGGRNQEVALSAALEIEGLNHCVFISLATDGEDGPTEAAGGIVNGTTIGEGKEKGLDAQKYLDNNDSFNYLKQTRSLIRIGPTGTNVNDLYLMIIL